MSRIGYARVSTIQLLKNIVFTAAYYDIKAKLNSDDKDKIIWTDLTFRF